MDQKSELSAALSRVHAETEKNRSSILNTLQINRADREFLTHNGWLQEIVKGWYMLVRPDAIPGESSAWYANFWDFVRVYLAHQYGIKYCLSAENSLDLHVDSPTIPLQTIVIAKGGSGRPLQLPFDTSLLIYSESSLPEERIAVRGIQVMSLPYALCKVAPIYFRKNLQDAQIALRMLHSPSELVSIIIKHTFRAAANRLVGAYRFLGNDQFADTLTRDLTKARFRISEENPFHEETSLLQQHIRSPYIARILVIWQNFRTAIIDNFPESKDLQTTTQIYLQHVEENYQLDAYNSLSIEGYRVSKELIERVQNNEWNPDLNLEDQQTRNALAARGYYEAFQHVKKAIGNILDGKNPAIVAKEELHTWYQDLFSPMVRAGILNESDLYGYRRWQVYIRGSRHIPFPSNALIDSMDTFFSCLQEEESGAVRAVLGHFLFVFIHPYMDGNGRVGRFLMNAMMASGGYPWTIIRVEKRNRYFNSLEQASTAGDIVPLTLFIAEELEESSKHFA